MGFKLMRVASLRILSVMLLQREKVNFSEQMSFLKKTVSVQINLKNPKFPKSSEDEKIEPENENETKSEKITRQNKMLRKLKANLR